ncbi:hypothetical protein KMP13_11520 [Epibacterium ulvae]|uniref:hypothetical protein n=1 Tax=Epibacterium ulvae TaxID=1156985 RepID=UPI001BFC12FE|nr:hypothetical protein [Epibacterium ulvae]MBT8154515.1 hypothetical protein [Epibacterium ulvae]
MKIILYIGHHKVGSTALQAYFARNTLSLLKKGILYPAVESEGLSHLLAQATGIHKEPKLACMNLREPHNALAFRMLADRAKTPAKAKTPAWHGHLPQTSDMLAAIQHQINVFEPHTVIICSEVLSNFGNGHDDLIAALRAPFPEAEFEIYCALRRPDEYLASWFGQRLRFGHKPAALDQGTALKDTKSIHFDYHKMIAPWVAAFPDSSLHLRSYDAILAAGGSVQDFTAQVGCTFPMGLSRKGPSNRGLSRAAFEVQRRANQDLPRNQAQALLQFLLRGDTNLTPWTNSDVELFGVELRHKLYEAFAPIDAYLGTLIGQDGFFPDLEWMRRPCLIPLHDAHAKLLQTLSQVDLPNPELTTFVQALIGEKSTQNAPETQP